MLATPGYKQIIRLNEILRIIKDQQGRRFTTLTTARDGAMQSMTGVSMAEMVRRLKAET